MTARDRVRYAAVAALLIAAGTALRLPALQVGFAADDIAQLAMVDGTYPVPRDATERFTFSSGDPAETAKLQAASYFPWWAAPELRLSLYRPLPSLLMGLDRWAFGDMHLAYHLHSLAWWWVLCGLVAMLFASLLPARWALVALGLYLLDESHTTALGWLANRNALMASAGALLALVAYRRLCQHPTKAAWGGYLAGVVLSFASGEYALAYVGFFIAASLYLDDGSGSGGKRLRPLWPVAMGVLLLLGARAALGIGARGSDGYIEPLDAPVRFAAEALSRLPALWGDAVLGVHSDHYGQGFASAGRWYAAGLLPRRGLFEPEVTQPLLVVAGLLAAACFAWLVRFAAGGRTPSGALGGEVRFAALGCALSTLPLVGSLPSHRHMLAPQLGIAIVMAVALRRTLGKLANKTGTTRYRIGIALVAVGIVAMHGLRSADASADGAALLTRYSAATRIAALSLPDEVDEKQLILVATDDPTLMLYVPMLRALHGRSVPAQMLVLSGSPYPTVVERTGARVLELHYLFGGSLLRGTFERLFRSPAEAPMRPGDTRSLPGVAVRVLQSDAAGRPTRVRFTFDRDLDDPRVVLLRQAPALQLTPLPVPPVGASTVVSIRPLR